MPLFKCSVSGDNIMTVLGWLRKRTYFSFFRLTCFMDQQIKQITMQKMTTTKFSHEFNHSFTKR